MLRTNRAAQCSGRLFVVCIEFVYLFLRSDIGESAFALLVGHGVALGEVTHGSAHFAVRSPV